MTCKNVLRLAAGGWIMAATTLAGCGSGGGGSGDDGSGISRSSIDLIGADQPGNLATAAEAAGAASAFLKLSALGPAILEAQSTEEAAKRTTGVSAKATRADCPEGGEWVVDRSDAGSGTQDYEAVYLGCGIDGLVLDGPAVITCELDDDESCAYYSGIELGTANTNFLLREADDAGHAITLLGGYAYPQGAASGTQDLQGQLYLLEDGVAYDGAGFAIEGSYTASSSTGSVRTYEGSFAVGSAGAGLDCGSGSYTVDIPNALARSGGSYTAGKLVLSSSAGEASVEFGDGIATVIAGGESQTYEVEELLALCAGLQ